MVLSERTACYLFGLAIALGPIGTARAQCDDGFTPALSTVNAQFDRTGISVHTRWPVREWEARRGVELEVLLPQIRRTGIEYYWPTNQLRSAYSPDLPARYQYVDTPTEDECEKWVVGTTRPTDLAGRVRLFFHGRETLPAGVTAGRFQTQLVDFDWLWGRLDRACALGCTAGVPTSDLGRALCESIRATCDQATNAAMMTPRAGRWTPYPVAGCTNVCIEGFPIPGLATRRDCVGRDMSCGDLLSSCGDVRCDPMAGEDCSNCPSDCGCIGPDLACVSAECVRCGARGATCCAGATCSSGLTCSSSRICTCPDADRDGFLALACGGSDCDDECFACHPGASEVCEGAHDENCDRAIDEGCACPAGMSMSCGTDVGQCALGMRTCVADMWSACTGGVGPTPELCDGVDNNCDGSIDEGVLRPFYADADGDGFASDSATPVLSCSASPGYVATRGDCDDSCASCVPGAVEICGNGRDDDCDGTPDDGCTPVCVDGDGDRRGSGPGCLGLDCNDSTRACLAWSGATERFDAFDNDCNGTADVPLFGLVRLHRWFYDYTASNFEHRYAVSMPGAGWRDDSHWIDVLPLDVCTNPTYRPQGPDGTPLCAGPDSSGVVRITAPCWGGAYVWAQLAECRNATTSWTIYVTTDSVEYADYASGLRPEWTCAGPSLGYVATASSATGTDGGYTEMRRHDCAAWTTSMWSTDRAEGAGTCTDTAAWFAVRGN